MESIRRHALIIGNSNYECEEDFPHIPYAAKDATRVFATLVETGKSIFDKNTSLCKTNLTRSSYEKTLGKFFKNIRPHDMVLFYFAGHAESISRSRKRSNDFSRSAKKRLKVATTKPFVKY